MRKRKTDSSRPHSSFFEGGFKTSRGLEDWVICINDVGDDGSRNLSRGLDWPNEDDEKSLDADDVVDGEVVRIGRFDIKRKDATRSEGANRAVAFMIFNKEAKLLSDLQQPRRREDDVDDNNEADDGLLFVV